MKTRLAEISSKVKELEEESLNYKNTLSEKSIEILEKEGIINKLNEGISVLKSGSKVEELVCYILD